MGFPIIADKDRRVSMLFGMLDPTNFRHGPGLGETMTVRSVFIISPLKRVELILSYPAYVGRSFDEILRVIDALQLSAKYRVATPANWRPGDDTVVLPFISDEEAERTFAEQGGVRRCGPTCGMCAIRVCGYFDRQRPEKAAFSAYGNGMESVWNR